MAIKIGSNFAFQGEQPNFERDRFATLAEMKAFPETSIDDGHLSYCHQDGNTYQFKKSNTVDTTTGKWRLFKTVADATLNGTSTNSIQNKAVFNALNTKADTSALNSYLTKTDAGNTYATKTKAFTTDTVSTEPGQFVAGPMNTRGNLSLRKILVEDLPTMTAATASAAGKAGIVPAPSAGKQGSFLRGDGTWSSPTFTVPTASTSTLGGVKVGTNLSIASDGKLSVTTDATVTDGSTKPVTSGAVSTLKKSIEGTLSQKANTSALNNYVPKTSEEALTVTAPSIFIKTPGHNEEFDTEKNDAIWIANSLANIQIDDSGEILLYSGSGKTAYLNGSPIATKADIVNVYKFKGAKNTYAELPTTGNVAGDVWNIVSADAAHGIKAGDNVAWDGSKWDNLSGVVDLSAYATKSTVNTISSDVATLMDKVFPFTVTATINTGLAEKGTSQAVKVTITAKKGDSVTQVDEININGTKYTGTIPYTYSATATTTTTYSVTVKKGTKTAKDSATINFYNASYYGEVNSNITSVTADDIKALATKEIKSGRAGDRIFSLDNQKACIAYPKAFGAAAAIKDANGFDYLASYDRSEATINGELYYVYLMKNATTITGMAQTVG